MAAVYWARGATSSLAIAISILSVPAWAQDQQASTDTQPVPQVAEASAPAAAPAEDAGADIVVTAQRQSERLQDVPIAVTAFDAAALEKKQIANSSDLQLTLPNVSFTKTNFTTSSFTIRGVGDLCVGASCDQATAIHMNGAPLMSTRLFEAEFFDLERVEVLRGPQGTLFGRNATSGVVNFVTAKPNLNGFEASVEADYGNYDSVRLKGMINVPVTDTVGVRLAGFYLNRGGYTENLYTSHHIDGRNMYGLRGSVRWEPSDSTTVDLMAYYFHENDDRMRIQKQMCHRDPTGVMGCLPDKRAFEPENLNGSLVNILSSSELLRIRTASAGPAISNLFASFGLTSLYGPDGNTGAVVPDDYRKVSMDFEPKYYASEQQYQAHLDQDLGEHYSLGVTAMYSKSEVDSKSDFNQTVQNSALYSTGIANLRAFAASPHPLAPYFQPIVAAVSPTAGQFCTSKNEGTGTGAFGGHKTCSSTPLDYDRSRAKYSAWSTEAILTSDYDGKFNFLAGAIYVDSTVKDNDYFVAAFPLDYVSGLLGAASAISAGLPPAYLGTPSFRNDFDKATLKSYGLFGEVYYNITDTVKLTAGLRYNHDKKTGRARSSLLSFLVPYSADNAFDTPYGGQFDADPTTACTAVSPIGAIGSTPGCDAWQLSKATFDAWTGRAVVDWKVTEDNLLYASYSRGYKSGGINPPLQPVFEVPTTFDPEFINAFELGSKNSFADGKIQLNATGFFYQYKALQLARIVARTAVNDNVDANVYGIELEGVFRPTRRLTINSAFSWLKTKVTEDKYLVDSHDPSGGRSDTVIVKDITNASNCAVVPTTPGNAAGANTLVTLINGSIGLAGPSAFPAGSGLTSTGAYGVCSAIAGTIANPSAPLRALFGTPTGPLPFTVENGGVAVNLKGNKLPQAPKFKWNVGAEYKFDIGNMTLVPRADVIYTGTSFGSIFNGDVNKVDDYFQINAQLQLNGDDDRWFVRAYVQNLTNNDAVTGLYTSDQTVGVYTNVFTLEPRRYGLAAGMKF